MAHDLRGAGRFSGSGAPLWRRRDNDRAGRVILLPRNGLYLPQECWGRTLLQAQDDSSCAGGGSYRGARPQLHAAGSSCSSAAPAGDFLCVAWTVSCFLSFDGGPFSSRKCATLHPPFQPADLVLPCLTGMGGSLSVRLRLIRLCAQLKLKLRFVTVRSRFPTET